MSGNKAGGIKAAKTNRRKYGADFYKNIGSIGGQNSRTGGFHDTELAERAGKLGGAISRKGYKLPKEQVERIKSEFHNAS